MNEMIEKIADVLDQDATGLTAETRLDEIGWDSMGMLSVIALAKTNGRTITGAQVRGFETVGDIINSAF
jgi:acyl carrier protein